MIVNVFIIPLSQPGASVVIHNNIVIGYGQSAFVIGMFIISIVLSYKYKISAITPFVLLFMSLLHPAWTLGAQHGGLGYPLVLLSTIFSAIGFCLFLLEYLLPKLKKKLIAIRTRKKPVIDIFPDVDPNWDEAKESAEENNKP